jgi:beta-galactosidase
MIRKALIVLFLLPAIAAFAQTTPGPGFRQNFGTGWEFSRDTLSGWERINLPHTARVEPLVVTDQWQGICWYRKSFVAPDPFGKLFLYFEGVMQEATVWVNGRQVAFHQGGYTPFTADLTGSVKPGQKANVYVRVDNRDNPQVPPGKPLKELDFNYYGGIYRNVWLITKDKLYITDPVAAGKVAGGGLFIHFDSVSRQLATGLLNVSVQNDFGKKQAFSVKGTLTSPSGIITEFHSPEMEWAPSAEGNINLRIRVANPERWSVETPSLYTLDVTLVSGTKIRDRMVIKTGIRKAEVRGDGFYLNGEKIFISGTNRHQEYPYVGYALPDHAQYRDAFRIKEAGFNFVRLSHYPHSESFMNACDELGLLVMDCIPGWQFFGDSVFRRNSFQDIRDLARRDRNHPSVIFWEVSLNESSMTDDYMTEANRILREELPVPGTVTAGWLDHPAYDLFIPARQHAKAPDYWNTYAQRNRKILIAEYGDWEYYAQNAGFNQTAFGNLKEEERTSRQLRAYGEKRLLQQAYNFAEASSSNRIGWNTLGEANWLMFDYNRGYSPDLESSGISDIFRIPKYAFWFYRSQRSADRLNPFTGPMLHIASEWNAASSPQVTVYSNCSEVALYLNNTLIGRQKPLRNRFTENLAHPAFVFDLGTFRAGELRAEGYTGGQMLAADTVRTALQPASVVLSCDFSGRSLRADAPDLIFVYARVTDANGTLCPEAVNPVVFSVEGEDATLIGQNPMNAEAGIATILLRTETFRKPVRIKASAAGLAPAEYLIRP